MNNSRNKRVEYIVWRDNTEGDSRIVEAVGFVTKESGALLTVSLTASYGRYIDTINIPVADLISREQVSI